MRDFQVINTYTNAETRSVDLYLNEVERLRRISVAEENALIERMRDGDQLAMHRLVTANLRFVISVAKRYQGQGVPFADLINEGNLGMLEAAGSFDATKGFKFVTYAVWWIRRYMLIAVSQQNKLIRIPKHEIQNQSNMRSAQNYLQQRLHREPTIEEIAEYLDMKPEQVQYTMSLDLFYLSADKPLYDDEDFTLFDTIPCPNPAPDEALHEHAFDDKIRRWISKFPERERMVINMSFGLEGQLAVPNEDIARHLNISPERVRQIKNKLLTEIRIRFMQKY